MKVSVTINMKMELYHKTTMERLVIDNSILKCYNQDSAEYKALCEEYAHESCIDREDDPEGFDKAVFELMSKRAVENQNRIIDEIIDAVRSCYSNPNVSGCVTFGGYIINPKDFCAVAIKDFSVKVKQEKE